MRIRIAVPTRPGSTSGNSITGDRWTRRLRELGHDVETVAVPDEHHDDRAESGRPGPAIDVERLDLFVALHATRCASIVADVGEQRPDVPIVVGLAGTDLYRDLPDDESARRSLTTARHLVVLQDDGLDALRAIDPAFAAKASVVHQSVEPAAARDPHDRDGSFTVVVLAHLRDVKDPLLAARAARLLEPESQVRVEHAGAAHDDAWAEAAQREMASNHRYTWHGPLDRSGARALLDRADVLACTSLLEGGANAVSEALAQGVPVIGTDIGGNRGLLGPEHPGLVPVGDERRLATLLDTLEDRRLGERRLLEDLRSRSVGRRWITEPDHERSQWRAVVDAALR